MKIVVPTEEEIMMNVVNDPYNYAAIYARESNTQKISALETQVLTCREYALKNDMIVYDVYEELVSASKRSSKQRLEFKRLIEDAKNGCFKNIIVTKRDRLARMFEDYVEIRKLFKKLDIQVHYSNDIQLDKSNDYNSTFIDNMLMAVAEMEPETIRERILAGMQAQKDAGIYSGKAPFGLSKSDIDGKYKSDDVKGMIVDNIFKIYVDNEYIKKPSQVMAKLKDKAEDIEDSEKRKKYLQILSEKKDDFIKKVIGRPTYAGLITKKVGCRFENFRIVYDEKICNIDLEYFRGDTNIIPIVSPESWYKSVIKFIEFNPIREASKRQTERERELLKGRLYCKECNKELKIKGKTILCETKKCISIRKSKFLREMIKSLVLWLVHDGNHHERIMFIVSELKKQKSGLQRNLTKSITDMGLSIEKYVTSPNDNIRGEIEENFAYQTSIRESLNEIENKIVFLEERFEQIIMPIVRSGFIDTIVDDIEENQPAILELLISKNIEELKVGGKIVGIKE